MQLDTSVKHLDLFVRFRGFNIVFFIFFILYVFFITGSAQNLPILFCTSSKMGFVNNQ